MRGYDVKVKVLGDGELTKSLTVQANKFSESAVEKIKAAGGSAEGGIGAGSLVNAWKVPDLRKKILFTAALLVVWDRLLHTRTQSVDTVKVVEEFSRVAGETGAGLLSLLDMFSGGALSRFTLFGLNVGPHHRVHRVRASDGGDTGPRGAQEEGPRA